MKKGIMRERDYKIAIANEVIDEMRLGLTAKQQNILDFMLKEINEEPKVIRETLNCFLNNGDCNK